MIIIIFSYLPIDEGSDPCAIFLIETAPLTWFILTSENKFVIKMCNVIMMPELHCIQCEKKELADIFFTFSLSASCTVRILGRPYL